MRGDGAVGFVWASRDALGSTWCATAAYSMGGVRYARTLLRMPEPQKWSVDMITDILTTQKRPVSYTTNTTEVEMVQNKPIQVRRLYILPEDLEEHGYTKNCRKCQQLLTHGPNTGTMPHSEECRARITAALSQTPAGRIRIQKMMEKGDKFIAEHTKGHNEHAAPAQGGEEPNSSTPEAAAPPIS